MKKGFTLIEMLVTIGIFLMMMLGVTIFFTNLYKENASDIAKIEGISMAGRALEKTGNEIRKMNRGEDGSFFISLADKHNFIFYSDVDNDGLTEKVEYFLNGTNLERRITEPGDSNDYSESGIITVLVSSVKNGTDCVFKYYDKDYTGTEVALSSPANVTQVNVIGIFIDVNINEKYSSSFVHVETKIHPRNLKNFN